MKTVEKTVNSTQQHSVESAEIGVFRSIKSSALRYLARRDYSRLELYQKLIAKGLQSPLINKVLDELQASEYQSDERFAEIFVRSRLNAGDGPFKIKIALRGKGVCDSVALAVIDKLSIDWYGQAKRVREKRFGQSHPHDITEMGKQIRYLQRKGFYQDHIDSVIGA